MPQICGIVGKLIKDRCGIIGFLKMFFKSQMINSFRTFVSLAELRGITVNISLVKAKKRIGCANVAIITRLFSALSKIFLKLCEIFFSVACCRNSRLFFKGSLKIFDIVESCRG